MLRVVEANILASTLDSRGTATEVYGLKPA
jgi:hypothetical protein